VIWQLSNRVIEKALRFSPQLRYWSPREMHRSFAAKNAAQDDNSAPAVFDSADFLLWWSFHSCIFEGIQHGFFDPHSFQMRESEAALHYFVDVNA
jgi:hypothetical protein